MQKITAGRDQLGSLAPTFAEDGKASQEEAQGAH